MGRIKNWSKQGDGEWFHKDMKHHIDIEYGDYTQDIEHCADLIIMHESRGTEVITVESCMDVNEIRQLACEWMRSHPDPEKDYPSM